MGEGIINNSELPLNHWDPKDRNKPLPDKSIRDLQGYLLC